MEEKIKAIEKKLKELNNQYLLSLDTCCRILKEGIEADEELKKAYLEKKISINIESAYYLPVIQIQ
jgi:hypothetical protein